MLGGIPSAASFPAPSLHTAKLPTPEKIVVVCLVLPILTPHCTAASHTTSTSTTPAHCKILPLASHASVKLAEYEIEQAVGIVNCSVLKCYASAVQQEVTRAFFKFFPPALSCSFTSLLSVLHTRSTSFPIIQVKSQFLSHSSLSSDTPKWT